MSAIPFPFIVAGGLDQETPALAKKPGAAIACLNHEATPTGYARTQGFERISGQPSPAAYVLQVGEFEDAASALTGLAVEGSSSGATGVIVAATVDSGSYGAGTAAGTFAMDDVDGEFDVGEYLMADDVAVARVVMQPFQAERFESARYLDYWRAGTARRRNAIAKPAGSGPVRGVLWFDGALYAWRDKADPAHGAIHKATPSGWQQLDLGTQMTFSGGGPGEFNPGDTIVGGSSMATAVVRVVNVLSGDWSTGDAAGSMIVEQVTGSFIEGEGLDLPPQLSVASLVSIDGAIEVAGGGRYEFVTHNFYGSTGLERAYGVNGVGKGFEFDGESVTYISTGMNDDRPKLVAEHKNHLFFAFDKGSLQNSSLGEPLKFDAITGAAEIGMGKDITNLIPNTADSMLVMTEGSISALTGNDISDFMLSPVSKEAGAMRYTAQVIGSVVYMDNRGVRNATTAQNYGNFNLGTYSVQIGKTLETKRGLGARPLASMVIKAKDQYSIFFDDRTGISFYMGRKQPEAMIFEYPFTITAGPYVAEDNGRERVFVGADDGHVYELNVGTSFDGAPIEAMVQLAYNNLRAPRALKRFHKIAFDVEATPGTQVSILAQFDNAGDLQPYPHVENLSLMGGGGIWGISNWAEFYWDAPDVARAETGNVGSGENLSPIIVSNSDFMDSYVIQSATVLWSQRGLKR